MSMSNRTTPPPPIAWDDPTRAQAFDAWLQGLTPRFALNPASLRMASADASFRRYFRIDAEPHTLIIMDAPPQLEDSAAFVQVATLMAQAGCRAPEVLDWQAAHGFMLLTDLGQRTLLQALQPQPEAYLPHMRQAIELLLRWQQASRPDVLPNYDEAKLRNELGLFVPWYVQQHRGQTFTTAQANDWATLCDRLVQHNLQAPMVYVHRDFMPRNLLLGQADALGVVDFQDAVYGPASYDIASLTRDAFHSWDEEVVLDLSVRYWEQARALGLFGSTPWAHDFGAFFEAVEWMGLQRHLKILGIFARLGLRDHKPSYLADTPRFIGYARHTARRYRALQMLLPLLDAIEGTDDTTSTWVMGRG